MRGNVKLEGITLKITEGQRVTEVEGPCLIRNEILRYVRTTINGSRIGRIEFSDPQPYSPSDSKFIIIPALVETHEHVLECSADGKVQKLFRVLENYASHGVGTVVVTVSLLNPALIRQLVGLIEAQKGENRACARIVGVGLEGVLISPEHPGILGEDHFNPIRLKECLEAGKGYICWASVAPEHKEAMTAMEIIASYGVDIAVAHTGCTYDDAVAVFRDPRVTRLIHTFNGMDGDIHKRRKTVVDAALENRDIWLELICDGFHWYLSRLYFISGMRRGLKRCVIVSDALVHGEPGRKYKGLRNEQQIFVDEQGKVTLADGTLAGGGVTLEMAARNVSRYCTLVDAINAASRNPADSIGHRDVGRIEVGALANLTIISSDLTHVAGTIVNGNIAYIADDYASELMKPNRIRVAV